MSDVKTFTIDLYRYDRRVGRISYLLADRAVLGKVMFITSDRELRRSLVPLTHKRWMWHVLVTRLRLLWAGGVVLRFSRTPSTAGRGSDHVLRNYIDKNSRRLN